jgi:diaminohydroxyphosphoribosylaminopyrimidine deaminase/5-amino-6-(5-phosphoribosylamino)uracil reductase
LGIRKLQQAGVEVEVGVLEDECRRLNRRFFTFHEKQRPWVTLKWAQSRDGFIDRLRRDDEAPAQFSTPFTQMLVHRLRARSQAILVGTQTALRDNPSLTNRLWPGSQPLRLVIDRHGILPPTLRLFDDSAPTHVYPTGDLTEILSDLHQRGIQSLLVEGGARLLRSFLDQGLWDEARVETAPLCLGQGVTAPSIPPSQMTGEEEIDGQKICYFSP